MRTFRFQTRIFYSYSLVIILLVTVALASFYLYNSRVFELRAVDNLTQLTIKTSDQLDSKLQELDRIALYVVSNPVIKEAFSDIKQTESLIDTSENGLDQNRRVIDTLASISVPTSQSYLRTSIYNIKKDYISMGIPDTSTKVLSKFRQDDYTKWFNSKLAGSKKLILPPHNDFWLEGGNNKMISLIRELQDLNTGSSFGIVEVQIPYTRVIENIKPDISQNIRMLILTEKNEVVFPSKDLKAWSNLEFYINTIQSSNNNNMKIKNPLTRKTEVLSFKKSLFSGWTLVIAQPEQDFLSPVRLLGFTVLVVAICLLLVTLILVFIMTKYLTKPLKLLRDSVRKVNLDNLSIAIDHPDSSNEISELNESFQKMFLRLEESMHELVQTRSHEMKAHMIALQSQMDPHFLYNMLSIISASSREIGAAKITDICSRLSNMLRYVTAYNQDFEPLKNEVEHAESYLKLMKIRFEDQFEYSLHVDDTLYNMKIEIPKLTLQPLLENSFKHGFTKVLPPWALAVTVGIKENYWFIEVTDNGIGFDEKKKNELFQRVGEFIKNPSTNIKDLKLGGMGLINTLVRLKLLYKDEGIIKIENSTTNGTKITLGGSLE